MAKDCVWRKWVMRRCNRWDVYPQEQPEFIAEARQDGAGFWSFRRLDGTPMRVETPILVRLAP